MIDVYKDLSTIVDKLSSVANDHGQEAVELGGRVYQLSAIGKVLVPLLFTFIIYRVFKRLLPVAREMDSILKDNDTIFVPLWFFICIIFIVIDSVLLIIYTLKPVLWMAAIDWRFALAAKVLGYL